jgi:hypothetical protein
VTVPVTDPDEGADRFDLGREIFARHDPFRLVSDDPDLAGEEYEPEVATLLARVDRASGPDEFRGAVHDVLAEWFGDEVVGERGTYDTLADELWSAWRGEQGR